MNSYAVIYKGNNKLYYFKSSEKFEIDDEVIVDTDKGEQYAKIVKIVDSLKTDDLKEILRKATKEDQDNFYINIKDKKIKKCKLEKLSLLIYSLVLGVLWIILLNTSIYFFNIINSFSTIN